MHADTQRYNETQAPNDREICELLARGRLAGPRCWSRVAIPLMRRLGALSDPTVDPPRRDTEPNLEALGGTNR
jgi:hypothetical protein